MGLILDTDDDLLGLEKRRESFIIMDLKRVYPAHQTPRPDDRQIWATESEHIFVACDGEIEVSKEFLRKLVAFFDNPENRKMLADDPLPKGYPQGKKS